MTVDPIDLDAISRDLDRTLGEGPIFIDTTTIAALVRAVRASLAMHDETSWEYTGMVDVETEWTASLAPFRMGES